MEGHVTTNEQLQRLLAASPAVIYSAAFPPGPVALFVSENVKTRFGWNVQDYTGTPEFWISHVHADDRDGVRARLAALDTTEQEPLTYRFLHADGSYRWVEDRINLVRDAAGRPVAIVGSWVDVSGIKRMEEEVRRMEEQFRQAQKLEAIGSLAGGVAHDFNNIIMVIQAYSQNLLENLPRQSELRREVEEIRKAGNRAAALTHQLLAFSRKETLNPREIDPDATVVVLSKMLGRLIGDNIRLTLDLHGERSLIFCDPTQLDQILINLVVNARDAMPHGGEVTIETRVASGAARGMTAGSPPGREVCISVKDVGIGMAKDVLEKIFDPFFTTKPAGKGTGLGLSMVYGAVQQNRGRIVVASKP
ncbi:MAG TPA: PAS domain-containing protein, partial [Spirochaetia bacterium]